MSTNNPKKELIIAGNPNINTIRNVIYFANKTYENIEKVYFLDSEDSLHQWDGSSVEPQRSDFARNYIKKDVEISHKIFERNLLHQEIPKLLSEQLKIYKNNQIIVDFTNGDKYISGILYASASLSKIENLFFIYVQFDKRNELPENLSPENYKIYPILNLENLESIGKYTQFEIIYYKNKADELIKLYSNYDFKSSFLKNNFGSEIESSIYNYFSGNYRGTISGLSLIIEDISKEICPKIKNSAKGKIKAKTSNDFNGSILWLQSNFCDPLRGKENQGLEDYEEQFRLLKNVDKIFDVIKVYRNQSSHPYSDLKGKNEAKLVLDNTLYSLELIKKSGVFD